MKKPAFVVDASVAVAWLFAGQATPETDALLARMQAGDVPAAPLLLYWEVGNVLATRTRRGALAEHDARALWKAFHELEITLDKNDYADAAMGRVTGDAGEAGHAADHGDSSDGDGGRGGRNPRRGRASARRRRAVLGSAVSGR